LNYLTTLKKGLIPRVLRHYPDPSIHENCSEFEVNNWVISEFIVKELIPVVDTRPFPINEQFLLTAAVCRFKPDYIFEWGTNIGKSARIFYEIANNFNIPLQVHSVDLPDNVEHGEHPHETRGALVKGLKNVFLYQGDGLDTCLEIYQKNQNIRAPLFFLDGDHSYTSIKRELSGIICQVKNPIFIIHDSFYQSGEANYNTGPHLAIENFLAYEGHGFEKLSTQTGLPGLTVLFMRKTNPYRTTEL
jgi:cephalosporin hydroxylase